MLLSAVSVLVVAQSSSEIPERLMNNPVHGLQKARNCVRKCARRPWLNCGMSKLKRNGELVNFEITSTRTLTK